MDNDFKLQLDLAHAIAAEIETLTDEFGPDADSHVLELKRVAIAAFRTNPLLQQVIAEVGKARLALRQQRVDVARQIQTNGVRERQQTLTDHHYGGLEIDHLMAMLEPGEVVRHVGLHVIETSARRITREQIRAFARPPSWTNSASWLKQYDAVPERTAERDGWLR